MSKLIVNQIEHHGGFTRPGCTVHVMKWTTTQNYLHDGTVKWTSGDWDNSTGTFTVPVAGKYLFSCTVQGHRASDYGNTQYYNIHPHVNNSAYIVESVGTIHANGLASSNVSANHWQVTSTCVIDVNANDTIRAYSSYGVRTESQNHLTIYQLI